MDLCACVESDRKVQHTLYSSPFCALQAIYDNEKGTRFLIVVFLLSAIGDSVV